jgi:hypothetical protein
VWVARFLGTPPMNVLPPMPGLRASGGPLIGFRPEAADVAPDGGSEIVFETDERTGADRLWHLRAADERVIVRVDGDAVAPERGTRMAVTPRRFVEFAEP